MKKTIAVAAATTVIVKAVFGSAFLFLILVIASYIALGRFVWNASQRTPVQGDAGWAFLCYAFSPLVLVILSFENSTAIMEEVRSIFPSLPKMQSPITWKR